MAKKGGNKDGYESSLNMLSEQKSVEPSRHKITKILETFPTCSRDHITKLLQYYNDDENAVIDALTTDGGEEASIHFSESANLKNKNNKNKKKKKKSKKESNSGMSATASFDADDSSSLHSSSNIDQEGEKEASQNENLEAMDESIKDTELFPSQERIDTPENVDAKNEDQNNSQSSPKKINTTPEIVNKNNEVTENATCVSPVSDTSDKNDKLKQNKDKFRFNKDEAHLKYVSRQRTGSFHRSKTNSLSDDNTSQNSAQAPLTVKKGAPAYDRCKKDLNRQTIYLQRIQVKLDKNLEEAAKRLKVSFNAVQALLQKRQEELEQELLKITEEASALIKSRQEQATELKRRLDRAHPQMESDWGDLRTDVKQFVTERKYDDLLGENLWYKYGMDSIEEVIKNFGELQPVKNAYSRRSHPTINNSGTTQGNQVPSPSSSIVNEEIISTTDKNDVSNAAESIQNAPTAEKEAVPQFRNQPKGETRSRIFSNTTHYRGKFNNYNRGGNRAYYQGRGRGNYPRPRYFNNYNNKNNYEQSNDFRNQSQQDRNGGVNEESSYNDKNVNNNPKDRNNDNKYHGRGYSNYRYGHSPRYRGNMNHRANNESNPKTETSETTNLNNEKTTVVNGYTEN